MVREQKFKIFQPKYYSRFQCDPDKCHETCCERWKILIDKNTYLKYKQSENRIIKEIVETGLTINEKSISDDDYGVIRLNHEMICPFLNQNNLCEVFKNIGEDSLSKTCKSYPRAIAFVNDVMERGLEMSCSVAADLALQNKNGIQFEETEDIIEMNDMYIVSPSIGNLKEVDIVKEIRTAVIDLLQTRTMVLSERLVNIGHFLREVEDCIDISNVQHGEVLEKIKAVKSAIQSREFKMITTKEPLRNRQQFHHLNTILSMKFKEGDNISFFSKRYIECLMEVLNAFRSIKDKELENYYERSYEKYMKPYLDKKGYMVENFLVNYVFIYGIELFRLSDLWTSYMKLCVVYGLLKFNLIGLAVYHKGVNDDLALKLMQSLSKTMVTDKTYWESVIRYLKKENLNDFTHLVTLIED